MGICANRTAITILNFQSGRHKMPLAIALLLTNLKTYIKGNSYIFCSANSNTYVKYTEAQ